MVGTRQMLGAAFPPMETRREVLVRAAVRAEELGYDAFFVGEAWGVDAPALIAEIATKTERILLGTAILSVWSRSAATLAMAATTLSQISGGRFVLGLGASTPQLTAGLHDAAFSAPLGRVRQVVSQIQALLQGERIPLSEGNDARALRLGGEPAPVPIYLAALAPASVRLTGEVADGWIPFFFPLSRLQEGLALLQEGNAKGSPPGHPCTICPAVGVAVAEDERVARDTAAWWVAFYLTSMGPLYAGTLERFGYGSEVAAVLSANPPRSTPVVPPGAESLIDELVICGTPSRAQERLARWYTEGAELLVVSFPPNRPWEQTEFALAGLAPTRNAEQDHHGRIGR